MDSEQKLTLLVCGVLALIGVLLIGYAAFADDLWAADGTRRVIYLIGER